MIRPAVVFDLDGGYTFYLSSSAPEIEVHGQLARRSLINHFAKVYGSDTPKTAALCKVLAAHPQAPVVFFGDSLRDYDSPA